MRSVRTQKKFFPSEISVVVTDIIEYVNLKSALRAKSDEHYPWRLASLLYFVTWCPAMLFLKARFWDDWAVYYSMSANEQKAFWKGEGNPPYVYEFQRLVLRDNPTAYHIMWLAMYFILGGIVFKILQSTKFFSHETNRRAALFFIILPINSARVAMIILPYTISVFLFYIAWLMLMNKSRLISYCSIGIFALSFYTPSVLPYFALPVATFVLVGYRDSGKNMKVAMRRATLILLAPVYYLLISRIIWPPAESRTAYFTPQIPGLIRSSILLVAALTIALWMSKQVKLGNIPKDRAMLLATGFLAMAFGSVAYFASGRLVDMSEWLSFFVPRSSSWDSRSQLLHGLGWSMLLAGFVGPVNTYLKKVGYRFIVAVCVSLNFTFMLGYYTDYLKQESMMQSFKHENLKPNSIIMIRDNTNQFNARGRNVRSYEWEAMILKATGLTKTVIDEAYVNCSPHAEIPDLFITINPGWGRLSTLVRRDAGMEVSYDEIAPCKKTK